jgi:hypothetical protein
VPQPGRGKELDMVSSHMIAANYVYSSTGISNSAYVVPKLLEETIGAKFNVVLGYKGGCSIDLAVEK